MNGRRILAAFLASVVCSGLFTLLLSRKLAKPAHAAVTAPVRPIVVVSQNMEAGQPLAPGTLTLVNWPAAQAFPGAFSVPQELAGRVLLISLSAGEPVVAHDLAAAGASTGLMARIPDGMRAMSVHADEVADVSGFVTPGSSVDVLVTYHAESGTGTISATALENVQVLAVGNRSETEPDSKPTAAGAVTLLVSPVDAVKLAQASSLGKIVLVLRNGADHSASPNTSATSFLNGGQSPLRPTASPATEMRQSPAAHAMAADGFTVETIAGGKASSQTFTGERQ